MSKRRRSRCVYRPAGNVHAGGALIRLDRGGIYLVSHDRATEKLPEVPVTSLPFISYALGVELLAAAEATIDVLADLEWRAFEDGIVATFPAELGHGFFVEAPEKSAVAALSHKSEMGGGSNSCYFALAYCLSMIFSENRYPLFGSCLSLARCCVCRNIRGAQQRDRLCIVRQTSRRPCLTRFTRIFAASASAKWVMCPTRTQSNVAVTITDVVLTTERRCSAGCRRLRWAGNAQHC